MSQAKQLERYFESLGVDCSKPEFYNLPEFTKVEASEPRLVWCYAQYVAFQEYSEDYLAASRRTVPRIIQFLYDALVEDGRLSACADASQAASKILERFGFWNFVQTGSLTIALPEARTRKIRYFSELRLPTNAASCGHAWLIIPPFKVVDFTVSRQDENEDLQTLLSPFIMETETEEVSGVTLEDMVDREAIAWHSHANRRVPTIHEMMSQVPHFVRYMRIFSPFAVHDGTATLKYFPCGPRVAEEKFDELRGHCFSGRNVREVLRDLITEIGSPEEVGYQPFLPLGGHHG